MWSGLKPIIKSDQNARSIYVPGKSNHELYVEIDNVRPEIINDGLSKMESNPVDLLNIVLINHIESDT